MTPARLEELEVKARGSRSLTVPHACFTVLVHGGDLLELVQLAQQRNVLCESPAFVAIANTLRSDCADWKHYEKTGQEAYPGEAKARREAYELLLLLLLQEAPCR